MIISSGVSYESPTADVTVAENSSPFFIEAAKRTFSSGSGTGVYKEGTVLNALDYFSSYRLGLWHMGILQAKLIGPTELGITLPNGYYFAHVHNTYIDWILRLGWIGGLCVIAWFVIYMVTAIRKYLSGEKEAIYSLLWIGFSLGFFMVERELWASIPVFMLLMLLYPLAVRFVDEDAERGW